ncbi:hypothetical protein ZWY2020_028925 [Hordeum vulgare]|nr:hypothetical protein ZWY2020_028925 [Hordeum vulgare]
MPKKAQLYVAMLALQFRYARFHVVSRLALNMGISKLVFPVYRYRNIIALFLLVPFFLLPREEGPAQAHPQLRRPVLLPRTLRHHRQPGLLPAGPGQHVAPIRLHHPELRAGHHLCHGRSAPDREGAAGPARRRGQGGGHAGVPFLAAVAGEGKNWTLGCVYLIGHCLSWSGWLVLQAPVLKKYPARLSVTSYTCFFGVIQFLVIAAFFERDAGAWVFHSGSEVFTILYAGFIASGVAFAVQWCIDRGGPVFVAVYQPVQTLVVAIMAQPGHGMYFIDCGEQKKYKYSG